MSWYWSFVVADEHQVFIVLRVQDRLALHAGIVLEGERIIEEM